MNSKCIDYTTLTIIIIGAINWGLIPGAVLDRGQRAVGTVGIPVRHHETCGRDGGHERILARFGAFDGLVVHHRVGAELEPFGGLLLDVGAERETLEGRTYGDGRASRSALTADLNFAGT